MNPRATVSVVALALVFVTAWSRGQAGTLITSNLPPGAVIININARQDGAAGYNGNQALWYRPFYTGGATGLLARSFAPGTYSFRVISPVDAKARSRR